MPASRRADDLVARIGTGDDAATSELLELFHGALPVERLLPMLRSRDDSTTRAAAFIASELGEQVAPVLDELAAFLDHRLRYVRFFLIDAMLVAAGSDDGEPVARTIACVEDRDDAVRWKALGFLARATEAQLAASRDHLPAPLRAALRWLLDEGHEASAIEERLDGGDRLGQVFAAAAAARLAPGDDAALRHAALASNADVRTFAEDELARHSE